MSRDAMGYPRTPYRYPEVLANWVIVHLKKTKVIISRVILWEYIFKCQLLEIEFVFGGFI